MRKFDRMKPILQMRRSGATYAAIGVEFGVSSTTIHSILCRIIRKGNYSRAMRNLWPAGAQDWTHRPFDTKHLPPDEVVDRWANEEKVQ